MKEYDVRKLIMRSKELSSSEKLVLLAIVLKVDWSTYEGKVSSREISDMISIGERSIKRTLAKLIKAGVISRESKRIGQYQNESAVTILHLDKIGGSGQKDTSVNLTTPPRVNLATVTISNNNKQYNRSIDEDGNTREKYTFTFQSSIKDLEKRKEVEQHIKSNRDRLSNLDIQRLLYPDLNKPLV